MPLTLNLPSPVTKLSLPSFDERGIKFYLKRDDLIHPWVQGNKWRKLKYSILDLKTKGFESVVSPGGAFSNHLIALAAICESENIALTTLIRGEPDPNNPSLQKLLEFGADLQFISRSEFRAFHEYISSVHPNYPASYFIPEGGTNALALKGVGEILEELTSQLEETPDYIVVPMGTGGTFSGLLSKIVEPTNVVGISTFTNYSFEPILQKLFGSKIEILRPSFEIFHFEELGRFAKVLDFLLSYIHKFHDETGIKLDPIYTGKMMWAIKKLCDAEYFPDGSNVLAIHTGGLQGWMGFNYRFPERGGLEYMG